MEPVICINNFLKTFLNWWNTCLAHNDYCMVYHYQLSSLHEYLDHLNRSRGLNGLGTLSCWFWMGRDPSDVSYIICCIVRLLQMYFSVEWWSQELPHLPHSATYMRQWIGSELVRIMASRLFGAKPLTQPMPGHCQLDPCKQTWVKF